MTEDEVWKRVEEIRRLANDDEAAHSAEDRLYVDVMQSIADGSCEDPSACAAAALKTLEIDFERWCV
jgi:hypothetical protein